MRNGIPFSDLVRRFGGANSVALYDPACSHFTHAGVEGVIGYRKTKHCAIVFGDPVCKPEDMPKLVSAFQKECEAAGDHVIYAAMSKQFKDFALKVHCKALIEVGEENVMDPRVIPEHGHHGRTLRQKRQQAERSGVEILELTKRDITLQNRLQELAYAWQKARRGPQIYLDNINLFEVVEGKRFFYALRAGSLVGLLILNRLEARNGWLFNIVMTSKNAPKGTSEFLAIHTMETLAKEGCRYVNLGEGPKARLGEIVGLGRISSTFVRHTYNMVNRLFHLHHRSLFWKKFNPNTEPSYVLFTNSRVTVADVYSFMRAYNVNIY